MTHPNLQVLSNINFISSYAVDVMKRNYASVSDEKLFQELNALCRKHIEERLMKEHEIAQKSFAFSKTAKAVIERIQFYFDYSLIKNNHKMRLTEKEFNYIMQRLSDAEKTIVEEWLKINGGIDKYIFSGYQGG